MMTIMIVNILFEGHVDFSCLGKITINVKCLVTMTKPEDRNNISFMQTLYVLVVSFYKYYVFKMLLLHELLIIIIDVITS